MGENKNYQISKDESVPMIVIGIICFWLLVSGFIAYFYCMHKISIKFAVILIFIFTLIYIPRFLIIRKLKTTDKIEILDDCILINGVGIYFQDIQDFRISKKKPQVIFFLNGKMILFQEAVFHLKLNNEQMDFNVIGTEKIELLKSFLAEIVQH